MKYLIAILGIASASAFTQNSLFSINNVAPKSRAAAPSSMMFVATKGS